MTRVRNSIAAVGVAVSLIMGGGCSLLKPPNANTPLESVAVAAATTQGLADSANRQLNDGRLSNDKAERIQTRFEAVYQYLVLAELALSTGNPSTSDDYLLIITDILTQIELELQE